jgi:hypothetical protein
MVKSYLKNHKPTPPLVLIMMFGGFEEIKKTDIKTIGNIDAANFVWPVNREQSLQLLDFFFNALYLVVIKMRCHRTNGLYIMREFHFL